MRAGRLAILTLAALHCAAFESPGFAQPPMTVTFIARGMDLDLKGPDGEWKQPGENLSLGGHAFLVISLPTSQGVKEDAYGFYALKSGAGAIKGPGMLRNEFRCTTEECESLRRFSKAVGSVTVPITEEERRAVLRVVHDFNDSPPEFKLLTGENCVGFVGKVVKALGYESPREWLRTPAGYLDALKKEVEKEQARREVAKLEEKRQAEKREADRREAERRDEERRENERREREAREAAEEDARRARVREAQRREAERKAEEQRVPAGWTQCNCPFYHRSVGKVVNGVLWHHPSAGLCP